MTQKLFAEAIGTAWLVLGGCGSAVLAAAFTTGPPDNIYLLTDGLPTQGEEPSKRTTVTPTERLRHFRNALGQLPSSVPINVVLFPMEGDPDAAQVFWTLAQRTGGSMLSPSRDWP